MDLHDDYSYYEDDGMTLSFHVLRVIGGWVYTVYGFLNDENTAVSSTFVPEIEE